MNEGNNLVDQIENDRNSLLFSIHEHKDQKGKQKTSKFPLSNWL